MVDGSKLKIIEANEYNSKNFYCDLCLVKYFPAYKLTLSLYEDKETVKMVDNSETPYDLDQLERMYEYLNKNGNLFYIAYKNNLVGDCAIFDDNMVALVVSKGYRGRKIGSKVLDRLITLAKEKDMAYLKAEIYDFNQVSKSLFKSHGFEKIGREMYKLDLV